VVSALCTSVTAFIQVIHTDSRHYLPSISTIWDSRFDGGVYEVAKYTQRSILGWLNPLKHEVHRKNI
jgi:hypothetical protein